MKNIICSIFGHQSPVYAEKGWFSPGQEYMRVTLAERDGTGRQHAIVHAECARCKEIFKVGRIHIPEIAK